MKRLTRVPRRWLVIAALGAGVLLVALGAFAVYLLSFHAPDSRTGHVSGVSGHVQDILAQGNQKQVFAVVGDSISASGFFLKPIAQGNYDLGEYGAFADTIDFFGESFAVESLAVHVGWTTENVLDPANNTWQVCQPDESPLRCEYRVRRPAVALIMLGTNDVAASRTLESYRANLRQIVQISIDQGVIPVLSTIPPMPLTPSNTARIDAFNQVVRETAKDFDIPLIDYWGALQAVPGYGISADGVHPNNPPDGRSADFDDEHLQYGYTVRNLLALDALDMLRRSVLE